MAQKPQNEKHTTLINRPWFMDCRKKNIYDQVDSRKCEALLCESATKANNVYAKAFQAQLKQKRLCWQTDQDIYRFLGLIVHRAPKTVQKWFYDVEQASWLGVDSDSAKIISEIFIQPQNLFFEGYDYKHFLNILLSSGNLKFFPVEKAAVSIMMRDPFKWWPIENNNKEPPFSKSDKNRSIMDEALKADPRFNATYRLKRRLDAHTKGCPENKTGLCLYEKNEKGEYRLILENLVEYLEQAP